MSEVGEFSLMQVQERGFNINNMIGRREMAIQYSLGEGRE